MNSRKVARKALAQLLRDNIPTLQAVYEYPVIRPENLSPFALVESDGTTFDFQALGGFYTRKHSLLISLYWIQTTATEDGIDDLSEEVFSFLTSEQTANDAWASIEPDPDFSLVELQADLRIERIRVIIW